MAATRMTIDALKEQVARIESEVGTQVSRLDAELSIAVEANTTFSTQLAKAFLLLGSQHDLMELHRKAFEEQMDTFYDKVLIMIEEFQERTRSLEGEIILLKQAMAQGTPSASDPPSQECLSSSLLAMQRMPKTQRTSSRTWRNISREYLLVNK